MRRRSVLAASLLLLGTAQARAKLRVVASFSVLADMVRQIGGDQVEVSALVGIGGDVHEYEPKPSDLAQLARADLIVVNGLGLDTWINRLIAASGSKALMIVAGREVMPRTLPGGITDPHAWHDPANGVLYARTIEAGLLQAANSERVGIAHRAERFIAAIQATDQWCALQFAQIPAARRQIITSHDAFGYYAAHYGLSILPVRGVENAEPSAADFAALVTRLQRDKGRVVFLENMTNPALLQSLAQETGAVIGGSLYADSLSDRDGPAATYLDMIRFNTLTIIGGLNKH